MRTIVLDDPWKQPTKRQLRISVLWMKVTFRKRLCARNLSEVARKGFLVKAPWKVSKWRAFSEPVSEL
jgi:hypothetical protein